MASTPRALSPFLSFHFLSHSLFSASSLSFCLRHCCLLAAQRVSYTSVDSVRHAYLICSQLCRHSFVFLRLISIRTCFSTHAFASVSVVLLFMCLVLCCGVSACLSSIRGVLFSFLVLFLLILCLHWCVGASCFDAVYSLCCFICC